MNQLKNYLKIDLSINQIRYEIEKMIQRDPFIRYNVMSWEFLNNFAGIYGILNLNRNYIYIGQSMNLYNRLLHHFRNLEKNRHVNLELQNDFNLNPFDGFAIIILFRINKDECDRKKLEELETYHIYNYYKNKGFELYNYSKISKIQNLLKEISFLELQEKFQNLKNNWN